MTKEEWISAGFKPVMGARASVSSGKEVHPWAIKTPSGHAHGHDGWVRVFESEDKVWDYLKQRTPADIIPSDKAVVSAPL